MNYNYYNPYSSYQNFYNKEQLLGKLVDSIEMVKSIDVPIGGYGIYPKADMTEIYIKTWNNDGTTKIITYKPEEVQPIQSQDEINKAIIERLNNLENVVKANKEIKFNEKKEKKIDY